jgi:glycerol-3-phosphate dehydrogenase
MWISGWREKIWSSLDQPFDLIVIGGGITGGGVFLEATRAGLKCLLVEAHDFASGTSSRSSKLVHGGFRYLKNGQLKMTFDSVRERELLLREGRGLVTQLGFIIASYKGDRIPTWALGLGLTFYDLMALKWGHQYYPAERLLDLCPPLNSKNLLGGYRYFDALTDDARLVLRIIREGVHQGGWALNYARVDDILCTNSGKVCGIHLRDISPDGRNRTVEVEAFAVVNATGVWADEVHKLGIQSIDDDNHKETLIRKLRGSHLVFPSERLSINRAVSIWHPRDKRPVFTFPWEGVTLIGTTDVDHGSNVETDPAISQAEIEYLLEAIKFTFPGLKLGVSDVQSTFAGIRAVVDTGKIDPSKESREHMLMYEDGFLTITGGKLTTFRLMAHQALNLLKKRIEKLSFIPPRGQMLARPDFNRLNELLLDKFKLLRLIGRYGKDTENLINSADAASLTTISSSLNLWAEIRWAAKAEGVIHLDDLLLRRVRLGILLPCKGLSVIDKIKVIVQEELDWDEARWEAELKDYQHLLERSYSTKPAATSEKTN